MMINIGFGTLMVAVGATPVSILPPILLAMGYSTYVAIALPAIGYDSLCTYALLGAPIVVFVDIANSFLGQGQRDQPAPGRHGLLHVPAGGLDPDRVLHAVDRRQMAGDPRGLAALPDHRRGHRRGRLFHQPLRQPGGADRRAVRPGGHRRHGRLPEGHRAKDHRPQPPDRRGTASIEKNYPLWKAFMPWMLLIVLILALNMPKDSLQLPLPHAEDCRSTA